MNMPVKIISKRSRFAVALTLCALAPLALSGTALAEPHGGGGAGHSFSGSHSSGGGHSSAPSSRGYAGGHAAAGHYAPHANYAVAGYGAGRAVHVGSYYGNHAAAAPRFAPGAGAARVAPGRYLPGGNFRYGSWNGGYWRGGFWPGVSWGSSFAWFLPVLPLYASAYWWNNVPYYYYNDVYYTYDPSASGYVVTTPPPALPNTTTDDGTATPAPLADASSYPAANDAAPIASGAPSSGMPQLYAYPKNGQSDEQQSADRQECARWASGQSASDGTGSSMDYQRAMTACLQGRGYSVN